MKATGIIVEYNPMHNGHVFHAQQSKAETGADIVIAVMSGNFLQRGEPAFVDKWTRTKMALLSGVDIVFELPYRFATGNAPVFADGAIRLLDAAGCHSFCFGSEDGAIAPFLNSLELINSYKDEYDFTVRTAVKEGLSYPMALNRAYSAIRASAEKNADRGLVDLSKPNNILGFHYLQAATSIGSSMKPATIKRQGADYHEQTLVTKRFASATGIRTSFFSTGTMDASSEFIPSATQSLLTEWQADGKLFGSWESFYPLARYAILRDGPERIADMADTAEGIEYLIYNAALKNISFQSFMEEVKSKRYTWTRIQRMLTHILTGFTYKMRSQIVEPSYLRLLGMTQDGQAYLNERKKDFQIPLVSKVSSFTNPSLAMDIHASDIYTQGIGVSLGQGSTRLDYSTAPIMAAHLSGSFSK